MTKRRVIPYAFALAGGAAAVLWAREVSKQLARIGAAIERQDDRDRERADQLLAAVAPIDALSRRVDATAQRVQRIGNSVGGLRRQVATIQSLVQRTPSATNELGRVYQRLVDHDHPMPELGGFAMTSPTLVWIVDQISSGHVSTILECGSGSSTVWFALALEQRGGPGRITSLESSAGYADQTRARLEELGLSHRAQVLTAPLVDLDLPGRPTQQWFDLSVLPDDVQGVDLLFVDGPVGNTSPQARYPGLPVMADRLTDDAFVVLDDSDRADEKLIIEQWTTNSYAGRRYGVIRELYRATVLRSVAVAEQPIPDPQASQG